MNEILKFYCKFCNDGIARTRKGIRKHLKENHLRNNFFGEKDRKDNSAKLARVRIEVFK